MKKLIVLSMLLSAPLFAMECDLPVSDQSIGQDLYATVTTQFPNATKGWYGNGGQSTWSDTNMPAPAWESNNSAPATSNSAPDQPSSSASGK